ncbi:hypothetical protein [Aeribacillus sp. FSL M8-0254]|uniref:hypothetical protein n=1 Tax=Aeribacillus sp. FSL M8-0254 TaxID=2954577 RepID=UPI0025A519F6|nr:hypothetical protein QT234_08810 [Geobacillus stearothermophilus]
MGKPMFMDILRQTKNKSEREEEYVQIIDDGGMERMTRPLLIIEESFTITDKIRSTDQKSGVDLLFYRKKFEVKG